MATRMQQRRGTAAEWAAANPVLAAGEVGFETDTKVFKLGDGVTAWNALTAPYLLKTEKAADSDLLDGLDSTAFRLATSKRIAYLTHTWTITGEVKVASGDASYIPPMFAPYIPNGTQTVRMVSLHHRINSGTSVTFSMRRSTFGGGAISDIAGWTGLVAGTADGGIAPTSVLMSSGNAPDKVGPVVTAVSGTPKNLSITATFEHTF